MVEVLKHRSLSWSLQKVWPLVEAGGGWGGQKEFRRLAVGLMFLFCPVWCVSDTSQAAYLPSPKCHITPQRSSRFPPLWFWLFSDISKLGR